MLQKILAVVVGLVTAFALIIGGEFALHALFPMAMPQTTDDAALAAAMAAAPMGAKVGLIVVYFIAALVGALVAAKVARGAAWPSWVVTGLLLAASVANFFMLPHPVWLVAASLALIGAGGWIGSRFGRR